MNYHLCLIGEDEEKKKKDRIYRADILSFSSIDNNPRTSSNDYVRQDAAVIFFPDDILF